MASRLHRSIVVSAAAVLGLVAASCGGDGGIGATLADFRSHWTSPARQRESSRSTSRTTPSRPTSSSIFQTDLAEDALPTNEDGDVDEEGEGVTLIDEIEDIEAGSTESLTVTLDAGSYVFICNLPGHYAQGMHTSFTAS